MKTEIVPKKKYSIISYVSLLIGILCFLFVFITPTRIANAGNIVGDYITIALTGVGIMLSIITMTKKNREEGDCYSFINTVLIIFYILDHSDYPIVYWSN